MLVYYSGWGYNIYFYKDALNNVSYDRPMYTQGLFELPESAKKDFKYAGETYTNILFESPLTHPDIVKTYFSHPEDYTGKVQFHLCEEWEQNDDDAVENPIISKVVKFTLDDLVNIIEDDVAIESHAIAVSKPRKRLIPHQRDTTTALQLLYEIFNHYSVEYLDQLPAIMAWSKIIFGEFKSELIINVAENRREITLIDGEPIFKGKFLEKYGDRFKK